MRLAVLSDIHSNFVALEAVAADIDAQSPDAVVVAGDFLNRGPQPRAVWDYLRERGWPLLRGNHEDYVVAQCVELDEGDDFSHALWQPARWTAEELERPREALEQLPLSLALGDIQIWHGTTQRNNDGVFPNTPDDALPEKIAEDGKEAPPVFCCGHTHQPLVRWYGKTLIANAGAAGLPFDGDPRASWALVDWDNGVAHAQIRRVEYDRDTLYRAFESDGFLRDGGPLARVIRREIVSARPHLGPFVHRYADMVRAGTISLDNAVNNYLDR